VAVAGGVGKTDVDVPAVVPEVVVVPEEPVDAPPVVLPVLPVLPVVPDELDEPEVPEPAVEDEAGSLGLVELELAAAAGVAAVGLFCEEVAPEPWLPPQPAQNTSDTNITPTTLPRTTTLLTRDLLRSSGLGREYETVYSCNIGAFP
jgi:hypothetical protein